MCQVHDHQWRRLLIRSEVCLADDVENNRVEDTDAVDRVRVLGDRIDDLSSLVLFEASVVNPKISQVLQAGVDWDKNSAMAFCVQTSLLHYQH